MPNALPVSSEAALTLHRLVSLLLFTHLVTAAAHMRLLHDGQHGRTWSCAPQLESWRLRRSTAGRSKDVPTALRGGPTDDVLRQSDPR